MVLHVKVSPATRISSGKAFDWQNVCLTLTHTHKHTRTCPLTSRTTYKPDCRQCCSRVFQHRPLHQRQPLHNPPQLWRSCTLRCPKTAQCLGVELERTCVTEHSVHETLTHTHMYHFSAATYRLNVPYSNPK